jgi:hypothetical protein
MSLNYRETIAMLRKLPKKAKRETRFRSQRHLSHVRGHACVVCDASAPIEAAHVRMGSGAGMGQKPSDYLAVPLCKPCHQLQHTMGEESFWHAFKTQTGNTVHAVMAALVSSSPVRREIEAHRNA